MPILLNSTTENISACSSKNFSLCAKQTIFFSMLLVQLHSFHLALLWPNYLTNRPDLSARTNMEARMNQSRLTSQSTRSLSGETAWSWSYPPSHTEYSISPLSPPLRSLTKPCSNDFLNKITTRPVQKLFIISYSVEFICLKDECSEG